jgi:hypothetical protein
MFAVPLAVVVVAACSGGSSPRVASLGSVTTTTPAAAAPVSSPGVDIEKYAVCMRSHGVADFPDPAPGSGPTTGVAGAVVRLVLPKAVTQAPAFQAADKACQSLRPALSNGPPPITPQQQQDYLDAARCMRSHGINGFPDPVFTSGRVSFPLPSSMDANSPQFLAARRTCQTLIPAGLPYSS